MFILLCTCESGTVTAPHIQMRKLRHRKQSHTAVKWEAGSQTWAGSAPESAMLPLYHGRQLSGPSKNQGALGRDQTVFWRWYNVGECIWVSFREEWHLLKMWIQVTHSLLPSSHTRQSLCSSALPTKSRRPGLDFFSLQWSQRIWLLVVLCQEFVYAQVNTKPWIVYYWLDGVFWHPATINERKQ